MAPSPTDAPTPAPRPTFDALFADPRHYRADCRMLRTAVRRGWLNAAPQADRDRLLARFEQATCDRHAADPDGRDARAILAECSTLLELVGTNQRDTLRALRYCWAGGPGSRTTGRPRERWHVSDYPGRLDANALRRRAKAEGADLRTLHAIDVRPADAPDCSGERVALAVVADARYGWRVWLVCPRCGERRVHLYPTRAGVRCRGCAGVWYAPTGQRK